MTKVKLVATISAVPYAVRDFETNELLGYADEHLGPMTMSKSMSNLKNPVEIDVIEVDESAWD